jgi:hypothetical protein
VFQHCARRPHGRPQPRTEMLHRCLRERNKMLLPLDVFWHGLVEHVRAKCVVCRPTPSLKVPCRDAAQYPRSWTWTMGLVTVEAMTGVGCCGCRVGK